MEPTSPDSKFEVEGVGNEQQHNIRLSSCKCHPDILMFPGVQEISNSNSLLVQPSYIPTGDERWRGRSYRVESYL